jgi:hypothetical protein
MAFIQCDILQEHTPCVWKAITETVKHSKSWIYNIHKHKQMQYTYKLIVC